MPVRSASRITRRKSNDHTWTTLRDKFKAYCKTRKLSCHICRQPIDYGIRGVNYPEAFEADHFHPVATHPELQLVWNNLRPSHVSCNRTRQDKEVAPQQDWVQPKW